MKDYDELNRILDEAINNVLVETTDRFNIPDGDPFKEPLCDPSETPMTFESYDPDDMKHIDKMKVTTTTRPTYQAGNDFPANVQYSYNKEEEDHPPSQARRVYERPPVKNKEQFEDKDMQDFGKYSKNSRDFEEKSNKYDSRRRQFEEKGMRNFGKYSKSSTDFEEKSDKYDSVKRQSTKPSRDGNTFTYKMADGRRFRVENTPTGQIEYPANSDEEIDYFEEPEMPVRRTINEPYEQLRQPKGTHSYPEQAEARRRSPKPQKSDAETDAEDSKEVTAEKIDKLSGFLFHLRNTIQETPSGSARHCLPHVIPRNEWGALPPMKDMKRMEAPAESFVFSLNTHTPECHEPKECVRRVKELQARHMGEGLEDIQYNFLVGGDGNMYEGRGWLYESGLPKEVGEGINYNIAFIGNHEDKSKITPDMLGPVQDLVVHAKLNKLVVGNKVIKEVKPPKQKD